MDYQALKQLQNWRLEREEKRLKEEQDHQAWLVRREEKKLKEAQDHQAWLVRREEKKLKEAQDHQAWLVRREEKRQKEERELEAWRRQRDEKRRKEEQELDAWRRQRDEQRKEEARKKEQEFQSWCLDTFRPGKMPSISAAQHLFETEKHEREMQALRDAHRLQTEKLTKEGREFDTWCAAIYARSKNW